MSLFLTLFGHLFTLNNVLQIKQYRYGALSIYNLNVMINKFIYHKDFNMWLSDVDGWQCTDDFSSS